MTSRIQDRVANKKNVSSPGFQYIIQKAPCRPHLDSEAKSSEMNSGDRFT